MLVGRRGFFSVLLLALNKQLIGRKMDFAKTHTAIGEAYMIT